MFNTPVIFGYIALFVVAALLVIVMVATTLSGLINDWRKRHPHYPGDVQSRQDDHSEDVDVNGTFTL